MSRRATAPRTPRLAWALPAAVAVVCVAGYAHTLPYAFHFDDFSSIRDNARLGPPLDLASVWAFWPSRVVTYASFALDRLLTGEGPAGMRAVNVLVHALAALVVGAIASALVAREVPPARRGGAGDGAPALVGLVAGALFAAHPLATQAVTYVVQRATSLCALLELAAVALTLHGRRTGRAWPWWAALGAAVLAAFTKEMSVALPVLLVLAHAAWGRAASASAPAQARRMPWARLAPFAAVWPLVAWVGQLPVAKAGHVIHGLRETADVSRWTYLLTELTVVPRYLALAAWPHGQNLDPDVAWRTHPDAAVLGGALLLAGLAAGALALARRAPVAAFGVLWCLAAFVPESSVFPIRDPMVEHRAYLPLAGLAIAAGAALARVRRRGATLALAGLAVASLTTVTHVRNRVWRDEESLWRDVVAKSPGRPRGYNDLAMALESQGRVPEAEAAYRRAIAIDGRYVYARTNLGRLLGQQGRLREAVEVLEPAARAAPGDPDVWANLGAAWIVLGDTARASAALANALAAAPDHPGARANLERLREIEQPARPAAPLAGARRGE